MVTDRVRAAGAWVVALVLVAAAGCGGKDPFTAESTKADPAGRAAVQAATGVQALPEAPLAGSPQIVGNHGKDLVAWGSIRPDRTGMQSVTDDGAVLDADTFSWTTLPPPPFKFPTATATGGVVGDELVVTGYACDADSKPVDSAGPKCAIGAKQAAALNLRTKRWSLVAAGPPSNASDLVTAHVVDGQLIMEVRPMDGAPTWWRYDSTGRRFDPIAAPPVTVTQVCSSPTTLAAVEVGARAAGAPGWQPWNMFAFNGGDLYGNARVSFWNTATNTWGPPSEPAITSGTSYLTSGCAGGSVVVLAAGRTDASSDIGAWVISAATNTWQHRDWPAAATVGPNLPPDPLQLKVVTDTQVRWRDLATSQEWSYQPATNQWTQVPPQAAVTAANGALTTATILGRPVLTDEKTNILTTLPA